MIMTMIMTKTKTMTYSTTNTLTDVTTHTTRKAFSLFAMMFASLALLFLFGARSEAIAALTEDQKSEIALQFIKQNGTVMASIMGNESMTRQKRRLKLKAIMENNFDLATMMRAIIGPYWRKMDEQQRERYKNASTQWIVLYSANFLSTIKPVKFEVLSASPLGKDVLVETKTQAKGKPEPVTMHWRVRFTPDDRATLIDMHFRGLSMVAAQRGEVSAMLAERGIPTFLDKIEKRLVKIRQEFNKN